MFDHNTIATERGAIMRSRVGILTWIFNSMNPKSSEHNTNQTDKPATLKMPQFAYQWNPEHLTCSEALKEHHEQCLKFYNYLIKVGVCREQARGVLPQNMYTTYYGTTNLNNLMKFVSLRSHEGAQWEIQRVAEACLDIAENLYPITVGAYRDICFPSEKE